MSNRMSTLLDRIFAVVPGTTIVLSTNTPAGPAYDPIIQNYNFNLTALVKSRQAAGQKIVLVDCHSPVSKITLSSRPILEYVFVLSAENLPESL